MITLINCIILLTTGLSSHPLKNVFTLDGFYLIEIIISIIICTYLLDYKYCICLHEYLPQFLDVKLYSISSSM